MVPSPDGASFTSRARDATHGDAGIEPLSIAIAAWIVGFALAAGYLAAVRDRPTPLWVVFGALIGPIAVGLLWAAPPGHCARCRAPVRGWLASCEWCGGDVRSVDPAAVRRRPQGSPATPASDAAPIRLAGPTGPSSIAAPVPVPIEVGDRTEPRGARAATSGRAGVRRPRDAAATSEARILASGIYLTGTVNLASGMRYSIAIDEQQLRILGPVDRTPSKVVVEHDLVGIDAAGFDERLVINEVQGGRHTMVLVFMALAGGAPTSVAQELSIAAIAAEHASQGAAS